MRLRFEGPGEDKCDILTKSYLPGSLDQRSTQSVERWSRNPGSRAKFPAGGLGVEFFATAARSVLKFVSF